MEQLLLHIFHKQYSAYMMWQFVCYNWREDAERWVLLPLATVKFHKMAWFVKHGTRQQPLTNVDPTTILFLHVPSQTWHHIRIVSIPITVFSWDDTISRTHHNNSFANPIFYILTMLPTIYIMNVSQLMSHFTSQFLTSNFTLPSTQNYCMLNVFW